MKNKLRIASLVMFLIALVFVLCNLACPTLGDAIYIGSFRFGAAEARVCYLIYAAVTVLLFIASFFFRGNRGEE